MPGPTVQTAAEQGTLSQRILWLSGLTRRHKQTTAKQYRFGATEKDPPVHFPLQSTVLAESWTG